MALKVQANYGKPNLERKRWTIQARISRSVRKKATDIKQKQKLMTDTDLIEKLIEEEHNRLEEKEGK